MLALVPEAALVYCMHLPVHEVCDSSTYGVVRSENKYMVVVAEGITHIT